MIRHITIIRSLFLGAQRVRLQCEFVESSSLLDKRFRWACGVVCDMSSTLRLWHLHQYGRCTDNCIVLPMAAWRKRTELTFFISHLVPKGIPGLCTETLTSTLRLPCKFTSDSLFDLSKPGKNIPSPYLHLQTPLFSINPAASSQRLLPLPVIAYQAPSRFPSNPCQHGSDQRAQHRRLFGTLLYLVQLAAAWCRYRKYA